ncbi:hypothetical protein KP509_17G050900 [Ceratopteris richardii]|uniref:Uncharacterized protein n=1 Tax=Ceratopteris richardii TaxID=49495 RepID=A0A8T2SUZ3_CERRI|nr:hypothetical protein KP509_17G050900 [Ceratopteris richardii]
MDRRLPCLSPSLVSGAHTRALCMHEGYSSESEEIFKSSPSPQLCRYAKILQLRHTDFQNAGLYVSSLESSFARNMTSKRQKILPPPLRNLTACSTLHSIPGPHAGNLTHR